MNVHPCWLNPVVEMPADVTVHAEGPLADTVRREIAGRRRGGVRVALCTVDRLDEVPLPDEVRVALPDSGLGDEDFLVVRRGDQVVVAAGAGRGLLYGWFHVTRELARMPASVTRVERPAHRVRMVAQWDNMTPHPVMGPVERGYAGASIFYRDGRVVDDLSRVRQYARLLASVGVNSLVINNVNVRATEARLLTDHLSGVARIASELRDYGITTYLAVSFAAPVLVGDLDGCDPLDPEVVRWWAGIVERVYTAVPDLGGFVVKADSENQPGPFAYGRDHADGANLLARALRPHGGVVYWRCFVYDCRQDWRDRGTDRARAAYDHFMPLDGRFDDNVVLQVKHGPVDFQVREPVSPLLGALRRTHVALELQITQEYTGQQRDLCYLTPWWRQILQSDTTGDGGPNVTDRVEAVVAVSNIGDDANWTGHTLAQANLFGYGRLTWDPSADPEDLLHEWAAATFDAATFDADSGTRRELVAIMADSWQVYERYTAPLGVGFMVTPGSHYGPSVNGYEYSPWGTYHFADRDGVGVDRTVATGTGYSAQYPEPLAGRYENRATCPDDLLLFFHHVPYRHVLHNGRTVIQHIYDTHFTGYDEVRAKAERWARIADRFDPSTRDNVTARFEMQLRNAREWRDQVNTYFFRMSGVPDAHGRTIHR